MNIFILDNDLERSAEMLSDQHLNKQILELAQVLSTVGYGPYKPTHKNHPATIWAAENLNFCFQYFSILAKEYYSRTGKWHKSYIDVCNYEDDIPAHYVDSSSKFPIRNDLELVKEKFREWLSRSKPFVPKWTNRDIPEVFKDIIK